MLFDNDKAPLNIAITLSESAANFARLRIFFRTNDNQFSYVEVYRPNGKEVILESVSGNTSGTVSPYFQVSMKSKVVKIDGTTIDTVMGGNGKHITGEIGITASGKIYPRSADVCGITRVEGYYL